MSSPIKGNTTFSQSVRTLAKAEDKKKSEPMGQQVSELAHQKKMEKVQQPISVTNKKLLNASILESSIKFSESISNQPQSLVLKAALQGINESLQEMGVESSVEEAYESGIDFSPEATAERIVTFSTQFYSAYQEQHPEMGEEESLTAFVDLINRGVKQGFAEARDILGGLKVLEGDIADNIDKTYQLVQEGLHDFTFSSDEEEKATSPSEDNTADI